MIGGYEGFRPLTSILPLWQRLEMIACSTTIEFYRTSLCPRCMLVKRELNRLRREFPGLEVEEIDVVRNPLRAWRSGIRMIPALKTGDDLLAGILLRRELIREFVILHLDRPAPGQQVTS